MYDWTDPAGNVWHLCGTCRSEMADADPEALEDRA